MSVSEKGYVNYSIYTSERNLHTRIAGYFDLEVHGSLRNGINGRWAVFTRLAIDK